ncbi:hypothetical protein AB7867_10920 [Rhodanobacter sp. FW510-T8]
MQANAALDAGDTAQAAALWPRRRRWRRNRDLAAAHARLEHTTAAPSPAGAAKWAGRAGAAPCRHSRPPPQWNGWCSARVATKNGDIMMPPGDSAYDLYRSALAIDGNSFATALRGACRPCLARSNSSSTWLAAGSLGKAGGDMLANLAELARATPQARGATPAGRRVARPDRATAGARRPHQRRPVAGTRASWRRPTRACSTWAPAARWRMSAA